MAEPIDSLRQQLLAEYSEENMKAISARIIDAYKRGSVGVLNRYAAWLGLEPLAPRDRTNRLFMKLIVHFHPDKRLQRIREIEELHRAGALGGLERLARGIGLEGFRPPETADGATGPSRKPVVGFEYEETYAYGSEDFGYSEEAFEGEWPEDYDGLEEDESEEYGFIEAVRAELFGNTGRSLRPEDLLVLDGELILDEADIEDLSGVEYCVNVNSLDLSRNRISELRPLAGLTNLQTLMLADNEISDVDPLAALEGLEELDLSGNQIEDVNALVALTALRYLNLAGNPIRDLDPIERLRAGGAIVIV
jgi:hypothetical protein